jgi:hypothetical protein
MNILSEQRIGSIQRKTVRLVCIKAGSDAQNLSESQMATCESRRSLPGKTLVSPSAVASAFVTRALTDLSSPTFTNISWFNSTVIVPVLFPWCSVPTRSFVCDYLLEFLLQLHSQEHIPQ